MARLPDLGLRRTTITLTTFNVSSTLSVILVAVAYGRGDVLSPAKL